MLIFETFSVVVVPFPFTDQDTTKRRPALVLSSTSFNASVEHSVLAMITSAKNSNWLHDVNISDLNSAGLSSDSIIRMKLFTLDNRLIIRKAGVLADSDQQAVIKACSQLFDINS
ncbi:type II toxin-antitoxin system PemK/MazF family toxin [Methylobacter sp. Wu8]|uniref:type II toxin-antitoxin system PemK/MazF family toxin n=1 Tax=Methylobacter sp. Wu8 TaxID=3118457 RepID=UPI002F2F183A